MRPHPDVIERRFQQAEFAADLTAVALGRAPPEYQDAGNFFDITFLTTGTRKLLTLGAQRLAGTGGEPVIGLQTAFGGGKTHAMLALWHLAGSVEPMLLSGLAEIIGSDNARRWRPARRCVLVGTGLGVRQRLSRDREPVLYTPWGLMAWRLAGESGLELMAEAESARSPPGSERLVALLDVAAPCLILFDELVAYARILDADGFEAFLSFIQSLTEAARMVSGALVVGSLIGSDAEAGGERGKDARHRLEKVFGRVQSAWLPAQADEQIEIILRRLFMPLDATKVLDREATVEAFADLYRANRTGFPAEAGEPGYGDAMMRSYPMHPELFRLFAEVWVPGANERFQQTRGVLRLMANVIHTLWQTGDPHPLILPGSIPLADAGVRSVALESLDPRFSAVLDTEVEGSSARPQIAETQRRSYAAARAMTRAARAVFMATAPIAGTPGAGMSSSRLRLACSQPNDQSNIFGDSLRELAESSGFLHHDAECYWFDTVPTLNRLAAELAKDQELAIVDAKLHELLKTETGNSKFARVQVSDGSDPTEVEDSRALRLVLLGPGHPHAGRSATDTPAMHTAAEMLERCGSRQRHYRNVLLFAAVDEARLDDARSATRRLIAWSIITDKAGGELQLPPRQQSEARSRRDGALSAARRTLRAAWSHLLVPIWPDEAGAAPSRGYDLHAAPIQNASGDKTIAQSAYDRAIRDGAVAEQLGAPNLRMMLDRVIGDQPHVAVRDLAEWSARYVHMRRLRGETVLANAIQELIGSADATYAWADGFDAGSGRYSGLRFGRVLFPETRGAGVLVRREVAVRQAAASETGGPPGLGEPPPELLQPRRRFFGVVAVENTTRPGPQVARITRTILAELAGGGGTRVSMKLGIEAERERGFSGQVVSAVTEQAKVLDFEQSGFE
ncbi:MAG TPA: DUF499 domain-containing protein [Acetobacteraceae bacterium]|nr:DUF499 domain-containing protein [Acetobacteraceae bacterium]